jgi:hypothetical protein
LFAEYNELVKSHAKFHLCASAVLIAYKEGHRDKGLRILNDNLEHLSHQVRQDMSRLFTKAKNQKVSAPRGAGSLVAESATEKGPTQPISYRVLSRWPVTASVKRRQGCGRP